MTEPIYLCSVTFAVTKNKRTDKIVREFVCKQDDDGIFDNADLERRLYLRENKTGKVTDVKKLKLMGYTNGQTATNQRQ